MTDFWLILVIIAIMTLGFVLMWKWDKFLKTLQKVRYRRREKSASKRTGKKR